jgi:hypothetical protein
MVPKISRERKVIVVEGFQSKVTPKVNVSLRILLVENNRNLIEYFK